MVKVNHRPEVVDFNLKISSKVNSRRCVSVYLSLHVSLSPLTGAGSKQQFDILTLPWPRS